MNITWSCPPSYIFPKRKWWKGVGVLCIRKDLKGPLIPRWLDAHCRCPCCIQCNKPFIWEKLTSIGFIAIFRLTSCFSYPKIKVSLSLEEKMLRLFHCSMTFSTQIRSCMWVCEMDCPKLGRGQVVHEPPQLSNAMLVEYQLKQFTNEHANILH